MQETRENGTQTTMQARRFVPRFSLIVGLFVAWWASFHEIACGGMSIRAVVPLLYTYASCYAFSAGGIIGVAAALLIRRQEAHEKSSKESAHPQQQTTFAIPFVVAVFAAVLFFLALALEQFVIAAILQTIVNAAAMVIVVNGIALMSRLSPSDAMSCLAIALAIYILLDNALFPAVISLAGSYLAVVPASLATVAVIALLAPRVIRMPEFKELTLREAAWRNQTLHNAGDSDHSDHPASTDHVHVAWQPLTNVAVYGFLLGLMHVESSSLISGFYARNLPYAGGAVLALGIFAWCFLRKKADRSLWPAMRNVVFPLTMLAFLALPLLDTLESWIPVGLSNAANIFYDMMLVLIVLYVDRETHLDAFRAACLAIATKLAAFLVGTVAAHLEINLLPFDVLHLPVCAIASFILLVAATLWIGDDRHARKLWGMRIELTPRRLHEVKLAARCDELARTYGLTPKERDVVLMLAQGKRPAEIADELFVSVNTTRTHIRNAYAALGVHSSKELKELVENVDEQTAPN